MVNNFGHETWTREGGDQVLNDTPDKLHQRVNFPIFLSKPFSDLRDTVCFDLIFISVEEDETGKKRETWKRADE